MGSRSKPSAYSGPLDVIRISNFQVDCVMGVYRREREAPQRVVLDVALYLEPRRVAGGGSISASVDYARLSGELSFLLHSTRFLLLEDAAEALSRYILMPPPSDSPRAQVRATSVSLAKPNALANALAAVEVHRRADDLNYQIEKSAQGFVDVVHEGKNFSIVRLRIRPGASVLGQLTAGEDEHDLILGAELIAQKRSVKRGMSFRWPEGLLHRYDNASTHEQSVLRVNSPARISHTVVADEEAELSWIDGRAYYPPEDSERDAL